MPAPGWERPGPGREPGKPLTSGATGTPQLQVITVSPGAPTYVNGGRGAGRYLGLCLLNTLSLA